MQLLGRTKGGSQEYIFIGADGIAAGGNGDVYVDTNTGTAWTSVTAIH